jgi:hypothetical protein
VLGGSPLKSPQVQTVTEGNSSMLCFDMTGRHHTHKGEGGMEASATAHLSPMMSKLFTESDLLRALGSDQSLLRPSAGPSWAMAHSMRHTTSVSVPSTDKRVKKAREDQVQGNKKAVVVGGRKKAAPKKKQGGVRTSSSANNILVGNPCSASNMRKRKEANSKRILNGDPNTRIMSTKSMTRDHIIFEALVPKTNSALMIEYSQSALTTVERFIIARIDEGSNAAKQGILAIGDEILEVNGVKVHGLFTEDILELVLNDVDTFVLLNVRRSRHRHEVVEDDDIQQTSMSIIEV